jgi:hypothetical protein
MTRQMSFDILDSKQQMTSENGEIETNENVTVNNLLLSPETSNDERINKLNHRIKTDFMSYCYSCINQDEEARQCVETVWNKYLQSVGEVAMVNMNNYF